VLRIVHSLLQTLVNKIEVRLAIFVLSSLMLIGLIFNAAVALQYQTGTVPVTA
jgi:hypothetical protein